MPKKVFVSYAQVPEEHKLRVAELVASLRAAGLSVFDQDVTSLQEPPEGWGYWINQIEQADWVLVVCNEAYYRWFLDEEPDLGRGTRVQRTIIRQTLYEYGMRKQKLFLVLLGDDETTAHIPGPLQRGTYYYRLPADLPKLTSVLTGNSPPPTYPS